MERRERCYSVGENVNLCSHYGFPRWLSGKESTWNVRNPPNRRRCGFDPWVRKIPWRRKWQLTPVFLPAKSHGQRSLEGYSPGGHKRVGRDLATKQQLQKIIQRFLRKLRVELPHNLAFSLLSIYLKKTKALIQKDICTSVLIAALFATVNMWKQPNCPLMNR